MATHIVSLPHDIIILVMQHLSAKELAALCCTCKVFGDMVSPQEAQLVVLLLIGFREG